MDIKDLEQIRDAIGAKTITTGTERNRETGDFIAGATIEFENGDKLFFVVPQMTRKVEPRLVLEKASN